MNATIYPRGAANLHITAGTTSTLRLVFHTQDLGTKIVIPYPRISVKSQSGVHMTIMLEIAFHPDMKMRL